jgi:hypothetical protein
MDFVQTYWRVVRYHLGKWPTRKLSKRPHVCSEMPEWSLTCLGRYVASPRTSIVLTFGLLLTLC